jgi:hypothetical protein
VHSSRDPPYTPSPSRITSERTHRAAMKSMRNILALAHRLYCLGSL